ncbi:four helix bundle protein [Candidatus Bipolaricaulota bacterium]
MDSFTQLDVWRKAHGLVIEIYQVTADFPNTERFRLTDQLCRSASSIPANIAEGKGRNTRKEYIQSLYTSRGSLEETKYHLILSRDLGYLSSECFDKLIEGYNEVGRMLNGLINSLKERNSHD